jgi:glycerol-3-phosphate dehydrogenase (NAD(P)+)
MKKKIAILGAGSWGTAIAITLNGKGHEVVVWDRKLEHIEQIKKTRENKFSLPGIKINEEIIFTDDIEKCLEMAEIVILAVASQGLRSTLERIKPELMGDKIIVNVSKGIEIGTLKRMSEVVSEFFSKNPFVALSGPSHAEEVSRGMPTTLVAASEDLELAELIQDLFITERLRVYTNTDVCGVEIGASLKNVIALGAGISDGLGYGDNAKAALMTRGIVEIARLGEAMNANVNTFTGLTGIGDLIVTCTSMHSRNRRCGILLGEGMKMDEAVKKIGMVVEGIYTTKSAFELAKKYSVNMPIVDELYSILYEDHDVKDSVNNLMTRLKRHEMESTMKIN